MLKPDALLRNAQRLLTPTADEADLRRAVSAAYYAVFDLFTTVAAATQVGTSPLVQDGIRRSIDHSEVRKVCVAVAAPPGSRQLALRRLLVEPLSPDLTACATNSIELQDARLTADYDLAQTVKPSLAALHANLAVSLAQTAFDTWPSLSSDPNTRVFLIALLFYSRWTRRA